MGTIRTLGLNLKVLDVWHNSMFTHFNFWCTCLTQSLYTNSAVSSGEGKTMIDEKYKVDEELWRKANENMAKASPETQKLFNVQLENIVYAPSRPEWAVKVKEILQYVASSKFLEEEAIFR